MGFSEDLQSFGAQFLVALLLISPMSQSNIYAALVVTNSTIGHGLVVLK